MNKKMILISVVSICVASTMHGMSFVKNCISTYAKLSNKALVKEYGKLWQEMKKVDNSGDFRLVLQQNQALTYGMLDIRQELLRRQNTLYDQMGRVDHAADFRVILQENKEVTSRLQEVDQALKAIDETK